MKKAIVLLLTALLILTAAAPALAIGWGAPAVSAAAAPFGVEVVKLAANTDATGKTYYTAFSAPGGAKPANRLFYAVKLTLPSYADANAYYGTSKLSMGSPVWVRLEYSNVGKKTTETCKVALTNKAQTLWYNGKRFEASWTAALNNDCGCGSKHILSADVNTSGLSRIRACVAARGELSDVRVGGCYSVEEKTYRGIKPCPNCKPVNLKGFLFQGDCAAFDVFFSANSKGKVTGVYCAGEKNLAPPTQNGTFEPLDATLYGWAPTAPETDCATGDCMLTFKLQPIPVGAKVHWWLRYWDVKWGGGYDAFIGKDASTNKETKGYFKKWVDAFAPEVNGVAVNEYDYDRLYVYQDGVYQKAMQKDAAETPEDARVAPFDTKKSFVHSNYTAIFWSDEKLDGAQTEVRVFDAQGERFATMYPYWEQDQSGNWRPPTQYTYGHIFYFRAGSAEDAGTRYLFKMLDAEHVDCDTNDASYLNAINHLLSLLGFTYQDVTAGKVYMTKDILLSNFGFNTASCSEVLWNH